jgi:hypothetical protein
MSVQESKMSKEAAVQPVTDQAKVSEVAPPVVEKKAPVSAEASPAKTGKQVAPPAAIEKVAPKPRAAKKAVAAKPVKKEVAEKPAPTPKAPAKPVKKAPAATKEKVAEAPKDEKAAKAKKQAPKKPKLVRDSFTIPEGDYALFVSLKQRALGAGIEVKKGEILRAALATLAKLDDAELVKAIGLVERIKTGRPKK